MRVLCVVMLAFVGGCTFRHGAAGQGGPADPDAATAHGGDGGGQDATGPGAIALDMQSTASVANSATLTWSHTVTANLVRPLLVVGVSIEKISGASVQGITYAGVPLTRAIAASGGAGVKAELWYLTAPMPGANSVVVTFTATLDADGAIGGALSLSGVDQTTPIATTATGGTTASMPSTQITTVNDRAWIVDAIVVDNTGTATPSGSGQQGRWTRTQGGQLRGAASSVATTTHLQTTMSWTSTPDNWAQAVIEIKP